MSAPMTEEDLARAEMSMPDAVAARLARKLAREESFDEFDTEVAAKILTPYIEAHDKMVRRLVEEVRRLRSSLERIANDDTALYDEAGAPSGWTTHRRIARNGLDPERFPITAEGEP